MSQSSVSRVVLDVSTALATLRPRYIQFPRTPQEVLRVQQRFFDYSQFPGVIGAVDCTHVPIQNPGGEQAQRFINRKNTSSLNVQMICDCDGRILNVVARWPGGSHDSRIFRESAIKHQLEAERQDAKWLLGDSGYGCQPYVMTPLLQPANPAEQRYNTAHKRGRCIIERTFGQMKRRFPCLKGLRLKLETTMTTIVAVTVLWNISLERREPEIDGPEVLHEIPGDIRPLPGGRNVEGLIRRDNLIRQHFA
eukprot:XP_791763.2 PREDICTED: putative nuclease HARBI1 [Strongylocentrotus purpuratus]